MSEVFGDGPQAAAVTPLGADARDLEQVASLVREAGTNFYRGMAVLAPDRRYGMYAIYAFCRIVDDIADDGGEAAGRVARLNRWRGRIGDLYRGVADEAVTRVLLRAVRAFSLRQADFMAVIDGMQMDTVAIVAPDIALLDVYCDRVASAVGRLSVRAFGDASAEADVVAHHLGRALQLTNILRDVREDAGRGRLYLPREILLGARVPLDPKAALASPGLGSVCVWMAELAREHFAAARAAMGRCDRKAMKPARLMAATYAALLFHLERRGWEGLGERAPRVRVPGWHKAWIVLRHGVMG